MQLISDSRAGLREKTQEERVRVVPLAEREGAPYREGKLENVLDGSYPLGRFLYLNINRAPGKPLHPMVREFCKFIFSKEGQAVVIKDGYMPVPYEVAVEELKKIESE